MLAADRITAVEPGAGVVAAVLRAQRVDTAIALEVDGRVDQGGLDASR